MPEDKISKHGSGQKWLVSNQALGIFLGAGFVLFFCGLYLTPSVHDKLYDGFSLGFFPLSAVALMVILSLCLVVDSHRHEKAAESGGIGLTSLAVCLCVGGGGFLSIVAIEIVGFLLVAPPLLILSAILLGMRLESGVVITAIVSTAIIYTLFRILGFTPPSGLLPI